MRVARRGLETHPPPYSVVMSANTNPDAVRDLYDQLLDRWNQRDAKGFAALFVEVNAIQSLVAVRDTDHWRAMLLQSTPAAFHGRPDLAEALTAELRALVPS